MKIIISEMLIKTDSTLRQKYYGKSGRVQAHPRVMIHLLTLNTFVTCWQMENILLPESDEIDSHEYYAWGDLQRQVLINMDFFCLQVKKTVSSFSKTHTLSL